MSGPEYEAEEVSSEYSDVKPERAIDGNAGVTWSSSSCTHTRKGTSPWWSVTLPGKLIFTQVTVYNRIDASMGYRLSPFVIFTELEGEQTKCASYSENSMNVPSVVLPCDGLGTKLIVQAPGSSRVLTLCEVAVRGIPMY